MKGTLKFIFFILFSTIVYGQTDSATTHKKQESRLDVATRTIELTYKVPKNYTRSPDRIILKHPEDPLELIRGVGNLLTSVWTHKDGECILFIECPAVLPRSGINKLEEEIPSSTFNRLRLSLRIGNPFKNTTPEQMEELDKIIKYWPQEKAKKVFNAQHVIIYPSNDPKAIYKEKYILRQSFCIIKWANHINVSFLLTNKGYKHMNKYVKDVQRSFWFND
ncbi:hypothetical protein [Arcticibacter tournemirensis]